VCQPGLPDGLLSNQKSQFGYILEGPRLESVYIFSCHLIYKAECGYVCVCVCSL
jgi:hypothetical protein